MNNLTLLSNYKKIVKNVSYLFKSLEKEFDYQDYKKQAFGTKKVKLTLERKMKNTYDAFVYLIENKENELNDSLLKRLIYLLYEEEKNNLLSLIKNKYYELTSYDVTRKMIEMFLAIKNSEELSSEDRFILGILFIVYLFYKENDKVLLLYKRKLKELKEETNKEKLKLTIVELIVEQKEDTKSYYETLKAISTQEIYNKIKEKEIQIKEKYKVKSLSIFGSFSKGNERIDSDIDLLVTFEEGLTYEKRNDLVNKLKEYMYAFFNRRVDILENSGDISDSLIEEINKKIKII